MPDVHRFRTNHASSKIIACVMWSRRPRSLRDGRILDTNDLVDALGEAQTPRPALTAIISRRAVVAANADSAARWLLVPGLEATPSELPDILAEAPMGIDRTEWARTLNSHLIDPDIATWLANGNAQGFVAQRSFTLYNAVQNFMHNRMEFDYEDTPSLDSMIIGDLEWETDQSESVSDDDSDWDK